MFDTEPQVGHLLDGERAVAHEVDWGERLFGVEADGKRRPARRDLLAERQFNREPPGSVVETTGSETETCRPERWARLDDEVVSSSASKTTFVSMSV